MSGILDSIEAALYHAKYQPVARVGRSTSILREVGLLIIFHDREAIGKPTSPHVSLALDQWGQ